MKITPFKKAWRRGIIIETDTGVGEVSPLPGFSEETYEEALFQLNHLEDFDSYYPSVEFGLASAAIPFPKPDPIPYAHFYNDTDVEHPCIKLKLGDLSLEEGIAKAKHVRTLCEHLRVDFNQKWSLKDALAFSNSFPTGTFDFIEEPTKDLFAFLSSSPHPVAVDEHLRTLSLDALLALPIKAAVIKPTLVGNNLPLDALKDRGIIPILSSSFESDIGLTHICHLHHHHKLTAPIGIDTAKFLK